MNDIIPINEEIATFSDYLDNNCRGILSARFGDGKSFFLDKMKERLSNRYIFITIYPVNYQVADNKDIFEYIKRDILLQILMLSEVDLTDEKYGLPIRLWGFLNRNGGDIASDIMALLASSLMPVPIKAFECLKNNIAKFKNFSNEINRTESDTIEDYLAEFSQCRGSIYEFDPISHIICRLVDDLKSKSGKEVVLIIEDMDRIDPAHIFRILNVFSAHWDIRDYSMQRVEAGNPLNKYNLDKVLLVCHFRNIKNIFHHLYGEKTDFTGYIHKFSSSTPYEYSLRDVIEDWILNRIPFDHDLYPDICQNLTKLIMEKYGDNDNIITNIRHITSFLSRPNYKIKKENFPPQAFSDYNFFIDTDNDLTRLLSVLNEFQISVDDFLDSFMLENAYRKDKHHDQICRLIGQCWILSDWLFSKNGISMTFVKNNIICECQQKRRSIPCKVTVVIPDDNTKHLKKYRIDYISIMQIFKNSPFKEILFSQQSYKELFSFFKENYLY